MGTATYEMPGALDAPFQIGNLGAFYESADADTALVHSDEKLISRLSAALDTQLLFALDARSASEFTRLRDNVWPKYLRALRALTDTVSNLVSEADMERISSNVLPKLSADLEKQRGMRFGDEVIDQALFTLWTLGKIRDLSRKLIGRVKRSNRKADRALRSDYVVHSLWAQFHLDCVFVAVRFNKPIAIDVQDMLSNGLRATVNAYSIMKAAQRLREAHAVEDAPAHDLPWDDEDEQLLAASMRDMNALSGNS